MQINCVEIVSKEKERIKKEIDTIQEKIKLVTIMVGNNPASEVYVRNKHKVCEEVGIEAVTINLPENLQEHELYDKINKLNLDSKVHGILVQLPLPKQLNTKEIVNNIAKLIDPKKDVDGFHPYNQGMLFRGEKEGYIKPCTPLGVMKILEHIKFDLEGSEVLVIGRSNILGKPLAQMLMQKDATILQLHSKSPCFLSTQIETFMPDLIVSCVGEENLIEFDDFKCHIPRVIIDCAIMRGSNGKLRGDFKKEDYDLLDEVGVLYTSVPKGVGTLTTTMLANNVLECYKLQQTQNIIK